MWLQQLQALDDGGWRPKGRRTAVTRILAVTNGGFNQAIWKDIRGTQNGWFIVENPIKMDDLGVPLFSETSISFKLDH